MLSLADICELAEKVVFYDADRDPCRVAIAGAGVGVSRGDDLESMSGSILVCGSELVGAEEPAAAESRALSMRAVLVAELQRAMAGDEPPATVRRSAPFSSVEAR
jgi:hypothetical protein